MKEKSQMNHKSVEGHTMSIMGGTLAAVVAFTSIVLTSPAAWAGAPASSSWTASPALTAQLGPEVKLGGYGIHPPRGFTMRQVNMTAIRGGGVSYSWFGPVQADKTAANFTLLVGSDHSGMMPGMTTTSFLQLEMSSMTMTHRNATASPVQQGTIHGISMARAFWHGIGPRTGKMFNGFFYGQLVGGNMIIIEAKDESPSSKTTMPLFNAAALTLRKL